MKQFVNVLVKKKMVTVLVFGLCVLLLGSGSFLAAGEKDVKVIKSNKGFLGVNIETLSDDELKDMGIDNGIRVTGVHEDSGAEKAGIKEGDVIRFVNGKKVSDTGDLVKAIREFKPGEKVKIKLLRGKKEKTVTAKLTQLKVKKLKWKGKKGKKYDFYFDKDGDHKKMIMKYMGKHKRGYLGISLENLKNDDFAGYFGVKAGEGALITQVHEGTPAEKAGLKAGDVVLKMDDAKIKKSGDITKFMKDWKEGKDVKIVVLRHKKKTSVTVTPELKKFSFPGNKIRILSDDDDNRFSIRVPEIHMDMDKLHDIDVHMDKYHKVMIIKEKKLEELEKRLKKVEEKLKEKLKKLEEK